MDKETGIEMEADKGMGRKRKGSDGAEWSRGAMQCSTHQQLLVHCQLILRCLWLLRVDRGTWSPYQGQGDE